MLLHTRPGRASQELPCSQCNPPTRTLQALLCPPIPSSKVTQYPADVPQTSAPPQLDLLLPPPLAGWPGGCATRGKGVVQQQGHGAANLLSPIGMPATGSVFACKLSAGTHTGQQLQLASASAMLTAVVPGNNTHQHQERAGDTSFTSRGRGERTAHVGYHEARNEK